MKFLRALILKNNCIWLLLQMCSWNCEKLKYIRSFNFTFKNKFFQHQYQKQVKIFVFTSGLVSHEICIHIRYFFDVVINKFQTINRRVNQKKIKSSRKEYVMWTCFKFWPMKNIFWKLWANENLILVCLQVYRESLSLVTFLQVYSNSKEVSYLSWQNKYPT